MQKLKQANLVTKTDFERELKSLNQKINSSKTKHLLVENELKKLHTLVEKFILKKMVHKIV